MDQDSERHENQYFNKKPRSRVAKYGQGIGAYDRFYRFLSNQLTIFLCSSGPSALTNGPLSHLHRIFIGFSV